MTVPRAGLWAILAASHAYVVPPMPVMSTRRQAQRVQASSATARGLASPMVSRVVDDMRMMARSKGHLGHTDLEATAPAFQISVDLGEATVRAELPPHYSSSRLLFVRLALPLLLSVEPHKGVMQISKDKDGLRAGDVLRAFTTFSWRSSAIFGGLLGIGQKPARSLFFADGRTDKQVVEALAANTEDKTKDILLIVERRTASDGGGASPAGDPLFWL